MQCVNAMNVVPSSQTATVRGEQGKKMHSAARAKDEFDMISMKIATMLLLYALEEKPLLPLSGLYLFSFSTGFFYIC